MENKINDELQSYKNELKENEKQIQILTKKNKHIRDHIKYLDEQIKSQKGDSKDEPIRESQENII